jgi:hypothetical protein
MRKASLVAILVCFVFGLVSPLCAETGLTYEVRGQEPSGEGMLADLAFARPVGVAAFAVGIVAGVVALPIALISCKPGTVYKKLVAEPFSYTFQRPLGEGM